MTIVGLALNLIGGIIMVLFDGSDKKHRMGLIVLVLGFLLQLVDKFV